MLFSARVRRDFHFLPLLRIAFWKSEMNSLNELCLACQTKRNTMDSGFESVIDKRKRLGISY